MSTRIDNLNAIAAFLRSRYQITLNLTKKIDELERKREFDAIEVIQNSPSYLEDNKFMYTLRELVDAKIRPIGNMGTLDYQKLYYALVQQEQKYVGKQEQPPALMQRGIYTIYTGTTKNSQEYCFNPQAIAASTQAKLQPVINVQSPNEISVMPNVVSVAPVTVANVTSPTGNDTSAPPVGDNPPTVSERERKILDVFERCYAEAGPMFKAAFDNALVDPKELFMPGVLVAAYIEVSGIDIGEIVSNEEYLAKSVSARKLAAYLK